MATGIPCPHGDNCRHHRVPPHGIRARYQSRTHPCRCNPCTDANTSYSTRPPAAPVPDIGTLDPLFGIQQPTGWPSSWFDRVETRRLEL